jgi:hypothetical protein
MEQDGREPPPFPDPIIIAGRRYWTNRRIRCWIALMAGQSEPEPRPDDDALSSARQVREHFGGVSAMWLWRRLKRSAAAKKVA